MAALQGKAGSIYPNQSEGGETPGLCVVFSGKSFLACIFHIPVFVGPEEKDRDRESSNFTHLPFSIVQIDEWIIVLVWEDGDERNLQNLFSFSNMEFWDSTMTNNCIISPPSYVKTSFLFS